MMKKLLLPLMFVFQFSNYYSQTNIVESIYTNHPGFSDDVDALMACAWEYSFELTISNSSCPTIEIALPSDLTFEQIVDLENCDATISGNIISVSDLDVGLIASIRVKMINLCDLNVAQISNLDISYDAMGCILELDKLDNLQVVIPDVTFDNLSYSDQDNLGAGQVDPDEELHQWLYFKNLEYEFTRSWDILVTAGHVRHLNIEYTPESEMNVLAFLLTGPLATVEVDLASNPIEISECMIIELFGTNYIDTDQLIEVDEVFTITECSEDGVSTQTDFLVEIMCKDNCQGDCEIPTPCEIVPEACNFYSDQHFNITVENFNSGIGITDLDFCNSTLGCDFDYNQGAGSNPSFIDFCGNEATDISYEFTCGAVDLTQNCQFSGAKRLESIQFPIDLDAFDFNLANDLNQLFLVANGVEVPFSSLPVGFLDFSTLNNICTIDFNLMDVGFANLWGSPMPFTNWFDENVYQDILDGTVFYIVFKNRTLDFENAEAIMTGQNLSEFEGLNFAYLFNTGNGWRFSQSYYRMCTMFSTPNSDCSDQVLGGQKSCQRQYDQFKYRNGIIVSGFAESSDPDVSFNQPEITVDFYFNDSGSNPWTFIWSGLSGPYPSSSFFQGCTERFYQIELRIPIQLEIRDLDGQNGPDIHYYNNTASSDYFDTDELDITGPFLEGNDNVYYISLSEENLLPAYSGIKHRNIHVSLGTSDNCPCGEFGEVQVSTHWRSVCDPDCVPDPANNVDGRFRLLGPAIATDLYYRCSGPCCGPAVSTCDFSFDRITPGWHLPDPLDTQPPSLVTLASFSANDLSTNPDLKQNRVYERDRIGVTGIGSMGPGEGCTDIAECDGSTGNYTGLNLESFYFDISYTNPNPAVQYFVVDSVESVFLFSDPEGNCDELGPILHQSAIDFVEYFDGTSPIDSGDNCSECVIRFHPPTTLYNTLWPDYPNWPENAQRYKVVLKSEMIVKETTLAEAAGHGFDQYPLIEGQFKYLSAGANEHQSCDPYHDNMLVFNTDLEIIEFKVMAEGADALPWDYPKRGGLCSRRYVSDYSIEGGLFGFDEFPNEFRPLLQIGNDNEIYNHFDLELPANYGLVQGCFSPRMKIFSRAGDANLWTLDEWKFLNHGSNVNNFGDNVSFENFYVSGSDGPTINWPILEHDGYPIKVRFRGDLASDCPLKIDDPVEEVTFNFPYRERFDPNDDEIGVHNPYTTPGDVIVSEISGTDHALSLTHGGGLSEVAIFDQIGSIDDLEIIFTSTGNAYYLDEAWIVDLPDDGVEITGIEITSPTNGTAINVGDGHWLLMTGAPAQGSGGCWKPVNTMGRNIPYTLNIQYAIDQGYCNTLGDDINLELGYGLTCFNLPPDAAPSIPEEFCFYDNYSLGLDLQESSAIWNGSNTFNNTWCSASDVSFVYEVVVLTNSASITNGQFTGIYPVELGYGNLSVNYNGEISLFPLDGGFYDIDLATIFLNGQLTEDDMLQLTFNFSGVSCYDVPDIGEFTFTFLGTDICGNYNAVNSTPDQVFIDFEDIDDENYFCANCVTDCSCDPETGDMEAPIFIDQLPPSGEINCEDLDSPTFPMVEDNCTVTVSVTYEDVYFSGSCLGSIERTWTAVDDCNNSATYTQVLQIIDDTSPILSDVPADANYVNISDVPPPPNVMATDNCDPSVSVSFSEVVNDNCPEEYTIVRTWSAIDHCENSVSASQTIIVGCTSEPKPFCFIQPDVLSSGFSEGVNGGNDVLARTEGYQIAGDLAIEGTLKRLFSGSYTYEDYNDNWRNLANFELDQNGNYNNYRLLPMKDNILGLGGYLNPEDGRYNTILTINNDDGDLLNLKEYREYTSEFYGSIQSFDFSPRLDLEKTYFPVIGHTWNEEINSDIFLMLVNPINDNYISKRYGGLKEKQKGRTVLTYGKEVITFSETTTKDGNDPLDLILMKLDKNLNQLITKRVFSADDCKPKNSISEHVNDADWSGGMAYFTGYITDKNFKDKAYVSCVDPESLDVLKTFTLAFDDLQTRGLKIRMIKGVGLYVVGEVFKEGWKQGFVALINVNGPCETDLQWIKVTHNNEYPDAQYSLNGIDVGNQELILTGTYDQKPSDPSIENEMIIINSDLDGKNSCCLISKQAAYKVYEFCSNEIVLKDNIVRLIITKAPNVIGTPQPESICDDKKSNDFSLEAGFSEIEVYPNPSNGLFNVNLNSETEYIKSITFYSIDGAQLLNEKYNVPDQVRTSSLDLSDLASGMYIIELESTSKDLYRKRINIIK